MMHLPQLIEELLSQQKQNNESRLLENLVEKLDAPESLENNREILRKISTVEKKSWIQLSMTCFV